MAQRISTKSIANQRVNREVLHKMETIEAELITDNRQFREVYDAYTRQVLALDNEGWKPLSGFFPEDEQISLEDRKELAAKAKEKAKTDPLIKSGLALRSNYIFGKGAPIEGDVAPRFQSIIDDQQNQDVLFSVQAQLKKERLLYTSGMIFTTWDKTTKKFNSVPFSRITDTFWNPESPAQVWYFLLEYSVEETSAQNGTSRTRNEKYWVATDVVDPAKRLTTIRDIPVKADLVMIFGAVNNDDDEALGTGDCVAALPWAWAYSEGLRDDLKIRKALASIAWLVKQKSAKGAANAGAKIASKGRGTAQTAVAAEGTELTSMPRAGSVNSTELLPVAAQAAAALGVSAVALTRSSGAASGSNAAETTLDTPSAQSAIARQEFWKWYYARCFRAMGMPKDKLPALNFPQVSDIPAFRIWQGLSLALEKGGISQKEYRTAMAEALDLIVDETLPVPTPWTGTKRNFWTDDPDTGASGDGEDNPDVLPGQGNSGGVGALDDTSNDARDSGEFDA